MAGHRKPRPTGLDDVDPIDEGTSCRSLSHPPGPVGVQHAHGGSGYGHKSSNQRFHAALLVRHGDRGPVVRALQSLLNLHIQPGPNLRIDGYFGTKTLTALRKYQTTHNLRDDGVAGHATWYRLTYTNPPKAARTVQPNGTVDVSAWPMPKRIGEVIRLLPGKLPHEVWNQLRGLMSTDLMVIAVALYAASHLFGAGEVIDIGIALIVAEQGVIELAECVQFTVLAMSPKDLDEAASHLARAISIITVFKFASLLARFLKNRAGANGNPPYKSTSQTPAPVPGETTGTAPPGSGETSSTRPSPTGPQSNSLESTEGTAEPKEQTSQKNAAEASLPKKLPFKLPKNPESLREHGFIETSHPNAAAAGHRTFENPQTGEKLRFDEGDPKANGHARNDHYHRRSPDATGKSDEYLDSDGNPCSRGSDESHLYSEEDQ